MILPGVTRDSVLNIARDHIAGKYKVADLPDKLVHDEAAFIPFAQGPWNCVGKGLAMQEMRTVVCALIQAFDFQLREGWDPKEYERGMRCFLSTGRPTLPVTLRRRS